MFWTYSIFRVTEEFFVVFCLQDGKMFFSKVTSWFENESGGISVTTLSDFIWTDIKWTVALA